MAEMKTEFGIERIYVKDLSFEAPHPPFVFSEKWQPDVDIKLGTKASVLDERESSHEVVLTVTVEVKIDKTSVFLVEVQQGGIFILKNFPPDQMRPVLGSYCPNILYPYAREVITDMVVRGGFPQFYLAPVNFDNLLEQHDRMQDSEQVH